MNLSTGGYWCGLCRFNCTNATAFASHKRSRHHKRAEVLAEQRQARLAVQAATRHANDGSEGLLTGSGNQRDSELRPAAAELPAEGFHSSASAPGQSLEEEVCPAELSAEQEAAVQPSLADGQEDLNDEDAASSHSSSSSDASDEIFTDTDSDDECCLEASGQDRFSPCAKLLLQAFSSMSATAIDLVLKAIHAQDFQSSDIPWRTSRDLKQQMDTMRVISLMRSVLLQPIPSAFYMIKVYCHGMCRGGDRSRCRWLGTHSQRK